MSETVGETDREMRGQRAGSEEGMREAADDSEETGRKEAAGTSQLRKLFTAFQPTVVGKFFLKG